MRSYERRWTGWPTGAEDRPAGRAERETGGEGRKGAEGTGTMLDLVGREGALE